MNAPTLPLCKACMFWEGDRTTLDKRTQGACHRYPLQPAGIVQQQGIGGVQTGVICGGAQTPAGYWCGEFHPATPSASNDPQPAIISP